jgi:hypothetical protein
MIGWRPYLVTVLAALLLAVGILDLKAVGDKPSRCESAGKLLGAGLLASATEGYAAALKADPTSECAKAGLAEVDTAQCDRARLVAPGDPAAARAQLLARANADPPPPNGSCVWRDLQALPAAKAGQ